MPTQQDQDSKLPPPIGSPEQAEKYLQQILQLLDADKIKISHTDLGKFDLASLQDHYRVDLKDYEIEISHSKQLDTDKDFYILLFNNIKKIQNSEASCQEKVILAYIHLTQDQFQTFKTAADEWLEKKMIEEEARRFKEAVDDVDKLLGKLASEEESSQAEESKPIEDNSSETIKEEKPEDNFFGTYPPYPQTSSF